MKTLDRCGIRRLLMSGWLVGFGANVMLTGEEFKEEFQQTYPLAAEGRLTLEHVNGKVRIVAWDRAEVKLEAVKRGKRKEDVAVKKNWPVGREVKTRLGKGGPKIEVSSVNGGLRLHLAETAEKN